MSSHPIININNLSCSYSFNEKEKVLFIESLRLERGKIIFLLGASGTGKSTLLETLGLMNNTISSGTVELFSQENIKYDYAQLWKNNNSHEINRIRKNFLSFIFQHTNLMENFTAYENICLSQMIKGNAVQSKAMHNAVKLMHQVRLPESEVGFETLSVNLSGGQRQRVSFVRALNSDYKLLLCDEPTGNLDEVNAQELLNIVKDNLTSDKTAVLVSHDVSLALKYADQIILITKHSEKGHGEILKENIFERSQWTSLDAPELNRFRASLIELFLPVKKSQLSEANGQGSGVKSDGTYARLFLKKEGKVLLGKSYLNLLVLIAIISLTFIAIGFANGALHYLNTKIRDPFVNWIPIKLPGVKSNAESVSTMLLHLNSDKVKKEFKINSATAYKETPLLFFPQDGKESEFSKGRLLALDDSIANDLFSPDNLIHGEAGFRNDRDLGVVVTKTLLNRLGYTDDARVIYLDNNDKDVTGTAAIYRVPVPVRAVIKQIPNRNNFIITNFFYSSYVTHDECIFDYNLQRKKIILFAGSDKSFVKQLQKEVQSNLSKIPGDYPPGEITVDIDTSSQLNEKGYALAISFNTMPEEVITTEDLYKQIIQLPLFAKNMSRLTRLFDFDMAPDQQDYIRHDYLSINFASLDQINGFSKHINTTLNPEGIKEEGNFIEIDTGTIKEKNNFNYMSKMTKLISGLLVAFSIIAISLFISNLLRTHLNKVKSNLGTYKAFGLSDNESKKIYLAIMLRFIFIGLVISSIVAYGLGKLAEKGFASQFKIEDQSEYFRLFDVQTYAVIAIIVFVTIVVSYFNINKILSKTPGDLIYNR